MRIPLFMILLSALSFAQAPMAMTNWQNMAVLAITVALMVLGLLYALGHIFDSNELKFLAKDEFAQIFWTMFLVGAFASFQGAYIGFSQEASNTISDMQSTLSTLNDKLGGAAMEVGEEGSKSIYCSFSAVGFGTAACGGYRMLAPLLSQAFQLTATAFAELNAMKFLMDSANTWLMNLLFPLGVFLRTFKYTRGAGNSLIATSMAFYVVLPAAISTMHDFTDDAKGSLNIGDVSSLSIDIEECDEYDIEGDGNADKALTSFTNAMNVSEPLLYYALIEITLSIVVSLAVTVASIRYITKIAGAEVDVSALGRLI